METVGHLWTQGRRSLWERFCSSYDNLSAEEWRVVLSQRNRCVIEYDREIKSEIV